MHIQKLFLCYVDRRHKAILDDHCQNGQNNSYIVDNLSSNHTQNDLRNIFSAHLHICCRQNETKNTILRTNEHGF